MRSVKRRQGGGGASATTRPRVLHVGKFYPPYRGGIETHLEILCGQLRGQVDVRVLVASEGPEESVEVMDGVEVVRAATPFSLAGAPVCPGMVRRIRESSADIVHLHLPNPAAVLAYLASGHRGKLVVSYHSDVVRQALLDAAFRPFLTHLLNRSDAIIAATPNYVASSPVLARHLAKCHVIPYGIPVDGFEPREAEVAAIRERLGDRLVLSVGRLVYYKGFESLIDAMPRVRGHLLIVGEGPLRGALEQRARAAGVAERVTFLGRVEDAVPYYHAADVFVLASVARSEAFGIVQIEAMACGRPVVNTSLDSGVPYVSRDGESGFTVRPGSPAELAGAIGRLLDDADLRARFGTAARRRVLEEFSQEAMTRRMVQLYHDVLGRARPAPARAAAPAAPRHGRAKTGVEPVSG